MIWPPAVCIPPGNKPEDIAQREKFFKYLKDLNIFKLMVPPIPEVYESAFKVGWELKDMGLWLSQSTGVGTLKWNFEQLYKYQYKYQQGNISQTLIGIYIEEPIHNTSTGWNYDLLLCTNFFQEDNICPCVDKILREFKNTDATQLTLTTLRYYINNFLDFNIETDDHKIIHIPTVFPSATDVIAVEYNNYVDIIISSWGTDGYYIIQMLNRCGYTLIDNTADDSYDSDDIHKAFNSYQICNQAFVKINDDYHNIDSIFHSANITGRKLLTFVGLDDDDWTSCEEFLSYLNRIFFAAQKNGWIGQGVSCYPKLVGQRICKYEDCNLCSKDRPEDWNTIYFEENQVLKIPIKIDSQESNSRNDIEQISTVNFLERKFIFE